MQLAHLLNQYQGRLTTTQGCTPKDKAINICWHTWPPNGRITAERAMLDHTDDLAPINIMDFGDDDMDPHKQLAKLGDVSHAWDEVIYLSGSTRSRLLRLSALTIDGRVYWAALLQKASQ